MVVAWGRLKVILMIGIRIEARPLDRPVPGVIPNVHHLLLKIKAHLHPLVPPSGQSESAPTPLLTDLVPPSGQSEAAPTPHLTSCVVNIVRWYLRPGQEGQVGEPGNAHQGLVDEDGVHGLLHTVLGVQGGQDHLHLLPSHTHTNTRRHQALWRRTPMAFQPRHTNLITHHHIDYYRNV